MARKKKTNDTQPDGSLANVSDYRYPEATRKNNPPAKIAAEGFVPLIPKAEYLYSPRRPPGLRFDKTGRADELPELLAKATKQKLTEAEAWALAEALRVHEPWLEWAGKRETKSFAVDPVALHIHERVSAQAILKVAAREDVNRSLFADPEQEYNEAVQFYKHDVGWSNRLILGDSLQVMSSLARREDLAGKVQMIYFDPPYGIRFGSNFQPEIGRRKVNDTEEDLSREPETVKAYRDTWSLGVHSYLAYLRDRLIVLKELLADTGSIFVQIGDENLHHVRELLDEIFGAQNFVAVINFKTMMPLESGEIEAVCDYICWYARDKSVLKYRNIYVPKRVGDGSEFVFIDGKDGTFRRMSDEETDDFGETALNEAVFKRSDLASSGYTPSCTFPIEFQGQTFVTKRGKSWRTTPNGVEVLKRCDRLFVLGSKIYFKMFLGDFGYSSLTNQWQDTIEFGGRSYVVQTTPTVIERCMLMTTDPGDLVLDPTCGSGTTAYVAEQWGRRWIAIDNFINAIFDGVWASVAGSVLTITSHSFGSVWQYHVYTELPASNTGSGHATVTGDLRGGTYGVKWVIDPTQTPILNRAFRDWNTDFFALLNANNLSVVCSFSQELVQPPDNPAGGSVWVQRFPDGTPVETATGFGTLNSSQIAFSSGPQNYMAQAHAAMAGLMLAAGLTPKVQFGEILWWFLGNASGMAFNDVDTQAAAQSVLGRALATFHTPNDDPAANGYADANFLRTRLFNYVAAIQSYVLSQYPSAVFELLWPMDVNDPDNCKLLRYINLPSQWTTRAGSGFDTFLIEGYQYPGINHNLDQASRCAQYPWKELAWDQAHCRYLMGLYYGTWPWLREFVDVSRLGLPAIKLWAYDHLCLFGWPVPLPTTDDRSFIY